MPTINGITASIHTHDGKLAEFNTDEFPGGVSCYIVAYSGQQFWLNYNIDHPVRAKAISVEFYVDGNRIDAQFPLSAQGTNPPVINPVNSSITSKYGKDSRGKVTRQDVFFALDKSKRRSVYGIAQDQNADKIGMIECKVSRAEKTGEWSGAIIPITSNQQDGPGVFRSPRTNKDISHKARLGAGIPAAETVRYTFRNLDPEDAPYASFRFYYRSKKFMERTRFFGFPNLNISPPITRVTSPVQIIARPLSRALGRTSSIYHSIRKGNVEKKSSVQPTETPPKTSQIPALPELERILNKNNKRMSRKNSSATTNQKQVQAASDVSPIKESPPERPTSPNNAFKKEKSITNLQATIDKLEVEITSKNNEDNSKLMAGLYEKLERLKKSSEVIEKRKGAQTPKKVKEIFEQPEKEVVITELPALIPRPVGAALVAIPEQDKELLVECANKECKCESECVGYCTRGRKLNSKLVQTD